MDKKVKFGLTVGIICSFLHFLWGVLVAIGLAQSYLNWIFPMHFISSVYSVIGFNLLNLIILIIMAFVGGFVFGWLGTWVYSWFKK